MKYLLFVALLLPSYLWAQEKSQKKNSIQIIKGIGIGYHFSETPIEPDLGSCLNKIESSKPGVNYRFGIDYQRQIIGGLSVKLGSRFSMWSVNDVSMTTSCWIGWGHPEIEQLRHYYIEVPFALQYKFGKGRLQFYVEAGSNPMFRVLKRYHQTDVFKFSVAVQVGAGLSYQLSNNCSIFGQLSSRVQTNKEATYGHLYEVGLELGVGFAF